MLRCQQEASVRKLGAEENLLAMLETGIASEEMTWTGKGLVMGLMGVGRDGWHFATYDCGPV